MKAPAVWIAALVLAVAGVAVALIIVAGGGNDSVKATPSANVDELERRLESAIVEGDLSGLYAMYDPEFRTRCSLADVRRGDAKLTAQPGATIEMLPGLPTPSGQSNDGDLRLILHRGESDGGDTVLRVNFVRGSDGYWISSPTFGGQVLLAPCVRQLLAGVDLPRDVLDPGQLTPLIGQDHWHAPYEFIVCGERQPNAPTWEGFGIHTHGDGVIHIHPFTAAEEGLGARLTKWFEYGGGVLTEEEVRLPGLSATHHNGDRCPDGSTGEVQVFANGEPVDLDTYIPQDGDQVKVVFGPPDSGAWEDDVPTVAP